MSMSPPPNVRSSRVSYKFASQKYKNTSPTLNLGCAKVLLLIYCHRKLQQLLGAGSTWGREKQAMMLTAAEDETWRTPATCRTLGRTKATTVGHFMTVTAAKPNIDLIVAGLSIVISRLSCRGLANVGVRTANNKQLPPTTATCEINHGAPNAATAVGVVSSAQPCL